MKINVVISLIFLLIIICSSSALSDANKKNYSSRVSIIDLIVNPEEYDGKKVSVAGYGLLSDDDAMGLYLNEDSAKHFIFKNAISLDYSYKNAKIKFILGSPNIPKLFSKYISIYGTFKMPDKSEYITGLFAGQLVEIQNISYIPDYGLTKLFKSHFDSQELLNQKLIFAVRAEDISEIKRLLSLGADANAKEVFSDMTALDYAKQSSFSEIAKILKQAGAKE